jgi:hypothetical protein
MPILDPTPPIPSFPPNRPLVPKITWGAAFANTLTFGYPLIEPRAYSASRDGLDRVDGRDGGQDGFTNGERFLLEGTIDIPSVDWVTNYGPGAGWAGATGWRAFLEWAKCTNPFRFYPNAALGGNVLCYLVEPWDGAPEPGWDFTRRIRLVLTPVTAAPFTGY